MRGVVLATVWVAVMIPQPLELHRRQAQVDCCPGSRRIFGAPESTRRWYVHIISPSVSSNPNPSSLTLLQSEDEALQAAIAASLDSSEPAPEKKPRSGKSTEIQFRLPDGTTVRGTFDTNDTILDLRKFLVEQKKELRGRKLVIANTFPKKEFGDSTLHNTLDQEKLVGRVQLAVLLK